MGNALNAGLAAGGGLAGGVVAANVAALPLAGGILLAEKANSTFVAKNAPYVAGGAKATALGVGGLAAYKIFKKIRNNND